MITNNLYLFIFFFPLLAVLCLTPIAKIMSKRYGLLDKPGELKIHKNDIPLGGGIAIFLGFFLVMIIVLLIFDIWDIRFWGILVGGFIVLFLGIADDLKLLRRRYRLFGQVLAGIVIFFAGIKIGIFPFLIASFVLTIFYIIGGSNAINLLDGMDGLAAGTAAIASAGFLGLSVIQNNILGIFLSLAILGAILGFLPYNFPPASIFMGNNGSYFLGFLLATLMIILTSHAYSLKWFLAPILVMGLPVMDTSYAIIRRARKKNPFFIGDRGHIYDQMMSRGYSQKKTLFLNYCLGGIFSLLAILLVI